MSADTSVKRIEPKYTSVKGSRGPDTRCLAYVYGPIKTAHEAMNRTEPDDHLPLVLHLSSTNSHTNNTANFRGIGQRIGNNTKHRMKQSAAARLQAPKTSSLSHRLTAYQYWLGVCGWPLTCEESLLLLLATRRWQRRPWSLVTRCWQPYIAPATKGIVGLDLAEQ